jgi:hypothetical protein
MDCALATLLACFRLSNLYIEGDIEIHDAIEPVYTVTATEIDEHNIMFTGRTSMRAGNPYGRLAIGLRAEMKTSFARIEVTISELGHVSSLDTDKDRGFNYWKPLAVTIYPFRR